MADEPDVQVGFGANIQALKDGIARALGAVRDGVGSMQSSFQGLSGALGTVGGAFTGFLAVLGGGAALKHAVDATIQWNGEAIRLSRTLGITTERASVLNVALGDIYSSTEEYLHAAGMMTRQLNAGGEGFTKLGISTKDSHGKLKDTESLMGEVIQKLNGIEAGTQRNAAGMAIFGRGWGEAAKLLKLNAEVMDEAKKKAEALNLIVGGDAVAAQKEYKAAMNDVGDVILGMKLAVGRELMPVLAELAKWFSEVAPPLITGLKASFQGLVTAVYTVKFVIETLTQAAYAWFETLIAIGKGAAEVLMKLATHDYSGAAAAARTASGDVKAAWSLAFSSIGEGYDKLGQKLLTVWDKKGAGATREGGTGAEGFDPGKDKKADSRMKEWEAALKIDQEKASEEAYTLGQFYERDLAAEVRYWRAKLSLGNLSKEETVSVTRKVAETQLALHKDTLDSRKAMLESEAALLRNDLEGKLEIARLEMGMHAAGSKGYEEARRKVLEVEREITTELENLRIKSGETARDAGLRQVDMEEQQAQHRLTMGEITAQQLLEQQRGFLSRRYELEQEYILLELTNKDLTLEQRASLYAKLLEMEDKYQQDRKQLKNQAAERDAQDAEKMFGPVTEAWNRSMLGMFSATMRFSDGIKGIWQGFGKALDQVLLDMVNKWIAAQLKQLAITVATKIKELVFHQSTAAATVATTTATAGAQVAAAGAVAGANAAASAAQTPFIGWAIAIPAGLAVLAAVMALKGRIGSAAGGWDLPSGDNPVAQLHAREMVLPATLADKIRALPDANEGGGGAEIHHHYTVQAWDSRDVGRFLRDHRTEVGDAGRAYNRDFGGRRA